jgi:hypothetical protein
MWLFLFFLEVSRTDSRCGLIHTNVNTGFIISRVCKLETFLRLFSSSFFITCIAIYYCFLISELHFERAFIDTRVLT